MGPSSVSVAQPERKRPASKSTIREGMSFEGERKWGICISYHKRTIRSPFAVHVVSFEGKSRRFDGVC